MNRTLLVIITLLNDNNIGKWFICYGSLLGLVRENSCIDNDDDIDIMMNKDNYNEVKKILIRNNFTLEYSYGINNSKNINSKNIIKTKTTSRYASIDIYMVDFNDGGVSDVWNGSIITDCFLDKEKQTFIERNFNGQKIYYPNNYKRILINCYGTDYNIKKDEPPPKQ